MLVHLFVCLFIQLLDTTPWLPQCHYDANDPSVCLLPQWPTKLHGFTIPRPLLWRFGSGFVISKKYAPKQNPFSIVSLPAGRTQHESGFICIFPLFLLCGSTRKWCPLFSLHVRGCLDASLACSFISLSLFPLDYSHGQLCRIKVLSGYMPWPSLMSLADIMWHSLGSTNVTCKPCQWTADERVCSMEGEQECLTLMYYSGAI